MITETATKPAQEVTLPTEFIESYKNFPVPWGPLGYVAYKRCVTIDTPILTKDLQWIPAGDITVGTEIIAFDENNHTGKTGHTIPRKIRIGVITHNKIELASCVEIELSNGHRLTCTPDHSWLVRRGTNNVLVWSETKDLLKYPVEEVKCFIPKYADVIQQDTSYAGGYLSAAFDGEGHTDGRDLHFVQVQNEMLDTVRAYLDQFGFKYSFTQKITPPHRKQCYSIRVSGNDQVMRFLMLFRPKRLLANYLAKNPTIAMRRKLREEAPYVVAVRDIGEKQIAVISTSTKTHITGGYPSHNTYARPIVPDYLQHIDTYHEQLKQWRKMTGDSEAHFKTEEWWQTTARCVNWYLSAAKGAVSAEEGMALYDDIMNLRCSFSGRGMWQCGTKTVERLGQNSLNNCYFVNIDSIDSFLFTFDMLMLGGGVGFNIQKEFVYELPKVKKGKVTRKETNDADFIVPDSREGWVDLLRRVLNVYFNTGTSFSFSTVCIRPAGSPIAGFGGTASGPEPLCQGISQITTILEGRSGKKLRPVDCLDILNIIGSIVVAGNVRRSAEIAIGDHEDTYFLEAKRFDLPTPIPNWRSMSNNSVACSHYTYLSDKFWKTYEVGGEPYGLVNLKLCREKGRLKDNHRKDPGVTGVNPCFAGDTLIAVADGRGAVSIKQLAEEGNDVPVYSLSAEGKVEIKWGRLPRKTGADKTLIRVHLDDSSFLDVTPDHKMVMRDGTIKLAKDLIGGDSLPRFLKRTEKVAKSNKNDYLRVSTDTSSDKRSAIFEHRLIAKFMQPEKWEALYDEHKKAGWISGGLVVHHKDYDSLNNAPDNLEIMTFNDHSKYHGDRDNSGENNSMYGKHHTDETKQKISVQAKARFQDDVYKQKMYAVLHSEEIRELQSVQQSERKRTIANAEAEKFGLPVWWVDGIGYTQKKCEICGKLFEISWARRAQGPCSISCSNKYEDAIAARTAGLKTAWTNKKQEILHQQIMVLKNMQEALGRDPMQKEWYAECEKQGVAHRFRPDDKARYNPYSIKNFSDLKEKAKVYNHRVTRIEELGGQHDVYNITVDDHHTVGIVTTFDKDTGACDGILTAQCGEVTLESGESCNLAEIFYPNITSQQQLMDVAARIWKVCKVVACVPHSWDLANKVISKNLRTGQGLTGVFQKNTEQVAAWADAAYRHLEKVDVAFSKELTAAYGRKINTSIKLTTVKPSGTLSLVAGVSPGLHPEYSSFYIRRIRMASNSSIVDACRKSGYPVEPVIRFDGTRDLGTVVVEFPVKAREGSVVAKEVTAISQLEMAKMLQTNWSDNSVSVTVYYRKEELPEIKQWLSENYDTGVKTVSFLLHSEHGFVQAPYEEITEKEYERRAKNLKPLDLSGSHDEMYDTSDCAGSACPVK